MTVVPGRPHLSVFGLYQRSRVRQENRVEAIVGSISAALSRPGFVSRLPQGNVHEINMTEANVPG